MSKPIYNLIYLTLCLFLLCCFPVTINAESSSQKGFELPAIDSFIYKWEQSGGSELGSSQSFITDLCNLIGVTAPNPPMAELIDNTYVFEKPVKRISKSGRKSTARVDLYKRGCFIWESKQGSDKAVEESKGGRRRGTAIRETRSWDKAMFEGHIQAVNYAKILPLKEQFPPFVLVSDIAYTIDIYADFRNTGEYTPFPSASTNRITLQDFRKPEVRELFYKIWTDPMSLDPSRISEKVTRDIAYKLFELAKSFEDKGYDSDITSLFILRCIFTMYAEDCNLLPSGSFTKLLTDLEKMPETFTPIMTELWQTMRTGGNSSALGAQLLQFNGSIFENAKSLVIEREQIAILLEAAKANWASVDTSIFGALLERALSQEERHKLGAHFTPTEYVERLIIPTIIEPERDRWEQAKEIALDFVSKGDQQSAITEIKNYYKHLSEIVVLDPSCGSGNLLAVSLILIKGIEDEVVEALRKLGLSEIDIHKLDYSIKPKQFRGIEVVQRAADISELVLWISYLQQHFKIHGNILPQEPILSDFKSIECRDAILAWDKMEIITSAQGKKTVKFINPRQAEPWAKATYIVGNPPYIGASRMRDALGDDYTEALRKAYTELPESVDYVLYWWHRAAILARAGEVERFGMITTNTISQTLNRAAIEQHINEKSNLNILFAIPDHPWYDAKLSGANVRVAMTVCGLEQKQGLLSKVMIERSENDATKLYFHSRRGEINTNLTIGADATKLVELKANDDLSTKGMMLSGKGFIITPEQAKSLGLGSVKGLERHIRPYLNGRDLIRESRNLMVIDLYGLTVEEVQERYPLVYQRVLQKVKPARDKKNVESHREKWWIFQRPRPVFRDASKKLDRYIGTAQTSSRSIFVFLNNEIIPDNALVVFSSDDAYILGILSSEIHKSWIAAVGGKRGKGLVYNKTDCFDAFPFPIVDDAQKAEIRNIAETIDKYRKERQKQHADLILSDMYAVMDEMDYGVELEPKEQLIYEQGDLATLYKLHQDLDIAVTKAYGFEPDLMDEEILSELLELNRERAEEESKGLIRWLRPEYQNR